MSTGAESVFELKCSCNQYPWGKQGSKSLSATLCAKQPGWDGDGPKTDFKVDESKPYAEMWMGSYPALPSYVASTGEDLQAVIDRHSKDLIGEQVINKFGHPKLPYLPKILSIAKALPLQIHPDKDMAAQLHKERPNAFTDSNHKPEIGLALTKFEAFAGFKPLDNIAELLKLEPLKHFAPQDGTSNFTNEHLRNVVRKMLQADVPTVRKAYEGLIHINPERYGSQSHIHQLAPRLAQQYDASDPGILVALITMNYLVLQPGEAVYVPADGIHAWLAGDIIECMARSNNVLNFGFCPRADRNNTDLVCDLLTFTPHSVQDSVLRPKGWPRSQQGKSKVFAPPMSEFDILETKLKGGEKESLEAVKGPSVLIATKGGAKMKADGKEHELKEGHVFFVAHDVPLEFEAGEAGLQMYLAFVE